MIRLALWVVAGILVGLVVHLVTLLALPSLATKGAYQRLAGVVREPGFRLLPQPTPSESLLPLPDPSVRIAVCRYDLSQGPVHIRAPLTGAFYSVSFYTPDGLNFYALTDRAAPEGVIELTLYTSLQLAEVRSREGPDTPEALRVEAPHPDGLVLIRAIAPEPGFIPGIERMVGEATCGPASSEPAKPATPADDLTNSLN